MSSDVASTELASPKAMIIRTFERLSPWLEGNNTTPELQPLINELRDMSHQFTSLLKTAAEETRKTHQSSALILQREDETLETLSIIQLLQTALVGSKGIIAHGVEAVDSVQRVMKHIQDDTVKRVKCDLHLKIIKLGTTESRCGDGQVMADATVTGTKGLGGDLSKAAMFFIAPFMALGLHRLKGVFQRKISKCEIKAAEYSNALATVELFDEDAKQIYDILAEFYQWWNTFEQRILTSERAAEMILLDPTSTPAHDYRLLLKATLALLNTVAHDFVDVLPEAPSNPILCRKDLESDPTINGQLRVFEHTIQEIPNIFRALETARRIIMRKHTEDFTQHVQQLHTVLLGHLSNIRTVLSTWITHLKSGFADRPNFGEKLVEMDRAVNNFTSSATLGASGICHLLSEQVSVMSVMAAVRKQAQEDKNKTSEVRGRKVATQEEGLEIHRRLSTAITTITEFSTELSLALKRLSDGGQTSSAGAKDASSSDLSFIEKVSRELQRTIHALENSQPFNLNRVSA